MKQVFKTIVNMKKRIGISLVIVVLLVSMSFLTSCQEDDLLIDSRNRIAEQTDENRGIERIFEHQETIRLTDGDYYVTVLLESDSQQSIQEYIDLGPSIKNVRIYKKEEHSLLVQDQKTNKGMGDVSSASDHVEKRSTDDLSIIFTNEHNIPKGYTYDIVYEHQKETSSMMNRFAARKESYKNYTWSNSGAIGVKTTLYGNDEIQVQYYSKGCCWYSIGWYHRGYSTLNYFGDYHTFNATDYSPYTGAKIKAYTTLSAWKNIDIDPIY